MTDKYTNFTCPHCGQMGEVIWRGEGAQQKLLKLSGPFHIEQDRLPGAYQVIICNGCDEIDPLRIVKLQ